jgi:hypothetical protein
LGFFRRNFPNGNIQESTTWTAELIEKGKKNRSIDLNSSQKAAVDKFIQDLMEFKDDHKPNCTSVDFYEFNNGVETMKKEDNCANWLGYKFLRQEIFKNTN